MVPFGCFRNALANKRKKFGSGGIRPSTAEEIQDFVGYLTPKKANHDGNLIRHALLLAVISFGLFADRAGAQDSELKKRFLDEAPKKWDEYRKFTDRLQGTVEAIVKRDITVLQHSLSEFKQNADWKLHSWRSLVKEDSGEEVTAYNTKYVFSLKRNSPATDWVMTNFKMQSKEGILPEVKKANHIFYHVRTLIQAFGDVSDLIRQPKFRVLAASLVQRDGVDLVKVDFDNPHPLSLDEDFFAVQGGTLFLDASRFWCVRACNLNCKFANGDSKIKVETELREPAAKYPIPKRCVDQRELMNPEKGLLRSEFVTEFELYEPSSLPSEAEFTLTTFGLPEPMGVVWHRGQPWYLYFGIGAFVMVILAVGFLHMARRRAASTPSA